VSLVYSRNSARIYPDILALVFRASSPNEKKAGNYLRDDKGLGLIHLNSAHRFCRGVFLEGTHKLNSAMAQA